MNAKSFKLIDTEDGSMVFTQIGNTYELKYRDEVLYYAEDTEDDFKFSKNIGKELDYFKLDALKVFLEMIGRCDKGLFEKYDVYQKV